MIQKDAKGWVCTTYSWCTGEPVYVVMAISAFRERLVELLKQEGFSQPKNTKDKDTFMNKKKSTTAYLEEVDLV